MTFPAVGGRASGVEGPGPMRLGAAGYMRQANLGAGGTGQDLSTTPTPQLVRWFLAGTEPLSTQCAVEIAGRFARVTATDDETGV